MNVLKSIAVQRHSLKLKLLTFETFSSLLNQFLFLAGASIPIPNFGYGPMVMLMTLIPTTTKRFNNWPLMLVMLFTRSMAQSLTRSTPQTFVRYHTSCFISSYSNLSTDPAAGASDDWYMSEGSRFVFTTELRDTGR